MTWTVALDPPAAVEGRTELQLNQGAIQVNGGEGAVNWGDAAIKAFLSEQLYGEAAVDFRVPNRVIEIPLVLGAEPVEGTAEEEKARRELQQKIALLQRQGGVLLRQREGGEPLYADIVNATLNVPDIWGAAAGVEPGVHLKLECLPDFYGEEIVLDGISATGDVTAVLQQGGLDAVIKGDYPARTRIVCTDTSGNSQRAALWGLRSTFYSAAEQAPLFLDSFHMTWINGTEEWTTTGVYGPSGKIARNTKLAVAAWHPILTTKFVRRAVSPTPLTFDMEHIGAYRVFIRAYCASPGGTSLRLAWSLDDATQPLNNAAAQLPASGQWCILDLGEIYIRHPPVGTHWWRGTVQAYAPNGEQVYIDRMWFQPLDDGAGRLRATATATANTIVTAKVPGTGTNEKWGEASQPWNLSSFDPRNSATHATSYTTRPEAPFEEDTDGLNLTNFDLKIPEGVFIHGIELSGWVETAHRPGFFPENPLPADLYIHLRPFPEEGFPTLIAIRHYADGRHFYQVGGPSSGNWTGFTIKQLNEAAFGFSYVFLQSQPTSPITASIYGGPVVTVWWSFEEEVGPPDAVMYGNQQSEIRFDGSYRENPESSSGLPESFVPISEETGDLPRLPPSGLELRPCELFLKASRGLLSPPGGGLGEGDPSIDPLTVTVRYRPCYIGRI